MRYTVTLDGIPLGAAELLGAPRAIGPLRPTAAFSGTGVRRHAMSLGIALRLMGSSRVEGRVVARSLAAAVHQMALIQDRLSLIDQNGRSAAIVHIVLAQFPRDPVPFVIAHLREQAAPVTAEASPKEATLGNQSRSAA